MRLTIEFDREEDGRWIAIIPELPGVMKCRATQAEALAAVKVLALQVLAEQIEHGELAADLASLTFEPAIAAA